MSANLKTEDSYITEEDYLKSELASDIKHEYMAGRIYAMSGASKNHERIAGNLYREFGNHLKQSPCEPFSSDIKVKAGNQFFYPDVMVVCEDDTPSEYYTSSPILIVEVLSPSSRRVDETVKRMAYQALPSLREYILIEQDFVDVEMCRLSEGWIPRHYFLGDEVHFECIGLVLPVEEIYSRVVNEDMLNFLKTSM